MKDTIDTVNTEADLDETPMRFDVEAESDTSSTENNDASVETSMQNCVFDGYGDSLSKSGKSSRSGNSHPANAINRMNVVNIAKYLAGKEGLTEDIERYRQSSRICSGFDNIDQIQPLYPGFYSIGAISGLGKTTFILQMADQIAESGTPVLYYALEQSATELVCKSIARRMYLHSLQDPSYEVYNSMQIRMGAASESQEFQEQRDAYASTANNQCIVECSGATVDAITESIRDFMAHCAGQPPVVVIDYLQIIQQNKDTASMDERRHIDHVIEQLKDLQMELNLVIICICSVNRANYLAPIGFESFKSSGNIEFTSDVVWGLQLRVVNKPIFLQNGNTVEKRAAMDEAKGVSPREIELVVLKNRFGRTSTTFYFDYYPEHDTYIARGSSNADNKAATTVSPEEYYRSLRSALSSNARRATRG